MNEAIKMQVSAFVDGELPQNEAELLLRRLCQDEELRQQAAEYLAMGRAMRGERVVAGTSNLRQRILAELGEGENELDALDTGAAAPSRLMRPVVGGAIAAAVALVALVGLQRVNDGPEVASTTGNTEVAGVVEASYTVPESDDDQLREYFLWHNASSSYIGANSINARLVTLQLREGVAVEHDDDAEASDASDALQDDIATQAENP